MDEDLIDRIYESAFVPEMWRPVLRQLGDVARARVSWMFVVNDEHFRFIGSTRRVDELIEPLLKSGDVASSERLRRLIAARHPGFLREIDLYTHDELQRDAFYNANIFPVGLGYAAATVIATQTADKLVVSVEREFGLGPVEQEVIGRLDTLRPHLARSLMTAARLRLQRIEAMAASLAAVGLPAVMVDEAGRALATNREIETLTGSIVWKTRDRVAFADPAADHLFRAALGRLKSVGASDVWTFPVRTGSAIDMIANLVPIKLSARDLFSRCDAALILTPVGHASPAAADVLQSLFDLTPAEARLARSLTEGEPLNAIATKWNVSRNTLTTHLKRVFAKTGCRRQAELVGLLGGVRVIRPENIRPRS